jgi:hypothetical protein
VHGVRAPPEKKEEENRAAPGTAQASARAAEKKMFNNV